MDPVDLPCDTRTEGRAGAAPRTAAAVPPGCGRSRSATSTRGATRPRAGARGRRDAGPCRSARPWRGPPGACGLARAHRRRQRLAAHRRDRPSTWDDVHRIRKTVGGTVNDVLIAVVAGAVRRWLDERGDGSAGVEPRALVPGLPPPPAHRPPAGQPALRLSGAAARGEGDPRTAPGRAGHHGPAQGPRSGRGAGRGGAARRPRAAASATGSAAPSSARTPACCSTCSSPACCCPASA